MKAKTLPAIALLASAVVFNGTARAAVVYTQDPNGNLIDTSAVYNAPSDPGFNWTLDMDEQVWADFSVSSNISFNRITWYGSNADGDFAVDFYTSQTACATPHSACGTFQVSGSGTFSNNLLPSSGPYSQAQTHKTSLGGGLYSYYIDLPSKVTLDSTQLQWLSIVNNYSAAPFSWAGSNTGIGSHAHYIVGQAMVLAAPGSLAFTLTDTTAPVPLPAAAWLFGSAIAGLSIIGRRRQSL